MGNARLLFQLWMGLDKRNSRLFVATMTTHPQVHSAKSMEAAVQQQVAAMQQQLTDANAVLEQARSERNTLQALKWQLEERVQVRACMYFSGTGLWFSRWVCTGLWFNIRCTYRMGFPDLSCSTQAMQFVRLVSDLLPYSWQQLH